MAGKEILFLAFFLAGCSAGVGNVPEPSTKQTINVPTNNFPTTNLPKNEVPKVNELTDKVPKLSNGTKENDDHETSPSYTLRATLVEIPHNENPYLSRFGRSLYGSVGGYGGSPDGYNGSPYGRFGFSYSLGKGYGGYQGYEGPRYGGSISGGYDGSSYGVGYGGDTSGPTNLRYGSYLNLNPIQRAPYNFDPYKDSYITSSTRYSHPYNHPDYRYNSNDPVILDPRTTCKDVGAYVEASDCCSGTTGRIDDSGYEKCCFVQGTSCAYAPDKCCGRNVCSSIGNPGAGVYICVEDSNNGRYSSSNNGTGSEEPNAEEPRDEPSMDNEDFRSGREEDPKGEEDSEGEGRSESPSNNSDSKQENTSNASEQPENNGNNDGEELSSDTPPNEGDEGGANDGGDIGRNEEVRGNNEEGSDGGGEGNERGVGDNDVNFWEDEEPKEEESPTDSTNGDSMTKRNSGYQYKSHPSRRNIAADRNVEDRNVENRNVEDRNVEDRNVENRNVENRNVEDPVIIPIANLVTV